MKLIVIERLGHVGSILEPGDELETDGTALTEDQVASLLSRSLCRKASAQAEQKPEPQKQGK